MKLPALPLALLPETVSLYAKTAEAAYGPVFSGTGTSLRAYTEPASTRNRQDTSDTEDYDLFLIVGAATAPEVGDKMVRGTDSYTVLSVLEFGDLDGAAHHYECKLRLLA